MTADPGYPSIKDRKQEAIEILRELATLDIMTDGYPPLSKYYDRIAPLIRGEFPEVLNGILHDLKMASEGRDLVTHELLNHTPIMLLISSAYDRLVQWVDSFFEQDKLKGTCPKCGGTKKVPLDRVERFPTGKHSNVVVDCPDCGDTGECQHKNVTRSDDYPSELPYCHNCNIYFEGRSGEERREGKEQRCRFVWPNPGKTTDENTYSGFFWDDGNYPSRRILPDRRTGECLHKGKMAYAAADNDNWLPRCLDCGEEVERRSGKDRRIGPGRREYDIHGGLGVGDVSYADRRIRTRRKAA